MKKVKLTLEELLNIYPTINTLLSMKTLPVKASYRMARTIKQIKKEIKTFEEQRLEIFNKYAVEREDKEGEKKPMVKQGTPEHEKYTKEMEALLKEELSFEAMAITLEMLEQSCQDKIEPMLTTQDIINLEPFISEKDLGKKKK